MKTSLLLVLILISFTNELLSNKWKLISPLPTGNNLYGIDFVNENVGWAVGDSGTILKTTDGGNHWFFQLSDTKNQLIKIQMFDESNGWIAGNNCLLKTTDGGNSWQKFFEQDNKFIRDISFINKYTGWIFLEVNHFSGEIYKTTNGGLNWKLLKDVDGIINGRNLNIFFLNNEIGWIFLNYTYKTTNGGIDWIKSPDEIRGDVDLFFINENIGWIVESDLHCFYKTTDGGINWVQNSYMDKDKLWVINFINENIGWAVGWRGNIVKTTDGGETWVRKTKFSGNNITSVDFINPEIGWCTGTGGLIMKTTDGGENWFHQIGGSNNWLKKIYFSDRNNGFVIGTCSNGIYFIKTSDGGKNWQQSSYELLDLSDLNNIFCLDTRFIYLIGENNIFESTILCSTKDSGVNWKVDEFRPVITDLCFFDTLNGYGSFLSDLSYRTTDGGKSWFFDSTNYHSKLTTDIRYISKLFFINKDTGWSLSDYARLYKTVDGGKNWYEQYFANNLVENIEFLNSNIGWIVGGYNTLIKTTDGGETWNSKSTNDSNFFLYDVSFCDENTGWLASNGFIYKTTDGGETWLREFSDYCNFNSIIAIDDTTVYAAGSGGRIYKYINDEEDGYYDYDTIVTVYFNSYPNPVSSNLVVDIPESVIIKKISIYDIIGMEYNCVINENKFKYKNTLNIDCSRLQIGVYYLRIFTDLKNYTVKFQVVG